MPRSHRAALAALVLSLGACGGAGRWSNYLEEHGVEAERHQPDTALEVLALVRAASLNDAPVRAVGSGHSSSEVARPRVGGAWIDVGHLDEIDMDWPYYAGSNESRRFVRVGAGATVREINDGLSGLEPRRALFNMGNYDAQTIAGAFSTGTHGSGIQHGPLTERIVAIEMVTDETLPGEPSPVQRLLRIEPTDGVTDPARFAAEHASYGDEDEPIRQMVLEQDDAVFDAALINLGAFGVITSVTVETRPAFWLREIETLHRWRRERPPDLEELAYAHPEFLQLTIEPHRILDDGGSRVGEVVYLETVRVEERDCDRRPPRRPPNRETLGRMLAVTAGTGFLERLQLEDPWRALRAVVTTFEQRAAARDYVSRSHYVLINSLAPEFSATSIDIQVPLENAAAAINRVLEMAADRETFIPGPVWEEWWHTSPLGIRFVGASRALLAPSHDGPVVSIEIPLLYDLRDGARDRALKNLYRIRMLKELEGVLIGPELGGRPHWGQRNWMTAPRARHMYGDRWDCWVAQYRRFNTHETFANRYTDQLCLSGDEPSCEGIEVAGVCGEDDDPDAAPQPEPAPEPPPDSPDVDADPDDPEEPEPVVEDPLVDPALEDQD